MKYDKFDRDSIYEYARKLIGKNFNQVIDEYLNNNSVKEDGSLYTTNKELVVNKGSMGHILEKFYFDLSINSESRPDFEEAEMELKVSPYKMSKSGLLSAKERLIISKINYENITTQEFYESNLWHKIKYILLIYYLYNPLYKDKKDYTIDYVYKYSPFTDDLKIIINDYLKIQEKVMKGKAHELSEGDTLYLGAATKAANSKVLVKQPFSEEKAKPRAFSFKSSYMTYLLRNVIHKEHLEYESIIKDKSVSDFEIYVESIINSHAGKSIDELIKEFQLKNKNSKDIYSRIALAILGVKTENAEEFAKANVQVKAIKIEPNGKIKEHISFPNFKINELLGEEWEVSQVYEMFIETKFLFVFFKSDGKDYRLYKSVFWNMPEKLLNTTVRDEWEDVRNSFRNIELIPVNNGKKVLNNLPKAKETQIIHVRPHASKSAYKINSLNFSKGDISKHGDILPNGDYMTKQCFWLNKDFVIENVLSKNS